MLLNMGSGRVEQRTATCRPRDNRNPVDHVDLLDRHLSAATGSDEVLRRYIRLLLVVGAIVAVVVGTSIAGAVLIAAVSPWAAGGLGSGAAATAAVTVGIVRARRTRGEQLQSEAGPAPTHAERLPVQLPTPGVEDPLPSAADVVAGPA
jgi:hypothetical protein